MNYVYLLSIILVYSSCNSTGFYNQDRGKPAPSAAPDSKIGDGGGDASGIDQNQEPGLTDQDKPITDLLKQGRTITSTRPTDIIVLFDTSGSMYNEMQKLQENLQNFLRELTKNGQALDYRIFIIARGIITGDYDPARTLIIQDTKYEVSSFNALARLYYFVKDFSNPNAATLQLRPEAIKQVVIISDDDADEYRQYPYPSTYRQNSLEDFADINLASIKKYLQANNAMDSFRFNAIVGQYASSTKDCHIMHIGASYIALAKDPEIGGLSLDLCTNDWRPLLESLARNIVSQAQGANMYLSQEPDLSRPIVVKADAVVLQKNQYSIDAKQKLLNILDPSIAEDASIAVTYFPRSS